MANEVKYQNQVWGKPIAGERLSTNGYYTGEQIGTVIQDAKHEVTAHIVEDGTVHVGTMIQDAIEGSTPKVAE